METYSVSANNCNSPKITFEMGGLTKNNVKYVTSVLRDAFRQVRVTCEQTGEIMYDIYYNDDMFPTTFKEVEAIALIQTMFSE